MLPSKVFSYLLFFVLLTCLKSLAQKPLNPVVDTGPKSKIELIRGDSMLVQNLVRTFYGDVRFLHRGIYLFCRKAIHNSGSNNLVAYGNIKINQGDTLTITGDTLYYDGNTRIAKIQGRKVVLTDDDLTLVSTRMNYDVNNDLANYNTPGIINQDSIQLSSETGLYNTRNKVFNYYGDVEILHPDFVLCTDTLLYNSNSKRADFNSFTTINSLEGLLSASEGYYFTNTKKSKFFGRSLVENDEYTLEADTLDFDLETEEGYGVGQVAFFNKRDSVFINGDFGEKVAAKGFTKITGNTLMRSVTKGDTLFLRANYIYAYDHLEDAISTDTTLIIDSLGGATNSPKDSIPTSKIVISHLDSLSEKDISPSLHFPPDTLVAIDSLQLCTSPDTLNRGTTDSSFVKKEKNKMEFIIAHGNVKIYRDDFQAKCDSLTYNLVDSIITFMLSPIIWSIDNQLEGNTITTNLVNNKIKTMFLDDKSFVIAQDTVGNFNQIKGREIKAFFDDETQIKLVEVEGNGESIYYATDDLNKIIGLNRVECSKMRLSFEERKVKRIAFFGNPESRLIPPGEIKDSEEQLSDFLWNIELKPTKKEVIGMEITDDKEE
ncbi:MAG: lipopolysaccharide export system protein LptA [Algoriphagus sp.]|jgi:lipopolysaccharide export system protein LptA